MGAPPKLVHSGENEEKLPGRLSASLRGLAADAHGFLLKDGAPAELKAEL
jgi:hypothetical protein